MYHQTADGDRNRTEGASGESPPELGRKPLSLASAVGEPLQTVEEHQVLNSDSAGFSGADNPSGPPVRSGSSRTPPTAAQRGRRISRADAEMQKLLVLNVNRKNKVNKREIEELFARRSSDDDLCSSGGDNNDELPVRS